MSATAQTHHEMDSEKGTIFSIGESTLTQRIRQDRELKMNAVANETRPRLMLNLDGVQVDFLYDTGAISTCMTFATYLQHFSHRPLKQQSNGLCAAGNYNLNYMGSIDFQVTLNGKTAKHTFEVCEKINDNCFGIGLIHELKVSFDGATNTLYALTKEKTAKENHLILNRETTFPANSVTIVFLKTQETNLPHAQTMLATIQADAAPTLIGGPALTQVLPDGRCLVAVSNIAPFAITLERQEFMGTIEPVEHSSQPTPLDGPAVSKILRKMALPERTTEPPNYSALRDQLLDEGTPHEVVDEILQILQQVEDILHPRPPTEELKLALKKEEPHFQRQPRIPEAHREFVEQQIHSWLQQGLIRRSDSMFNTPLMCISTPQGLRIVQDFRQLNQKLVTSSLSFKQVHEALGKIEEEKSLFFTTLDLSAAAWQLKLRPQQSEITSFSCPGVGQFEWVQAPHHLAGAEATFHRLLDATVGDLPGAIPHINRIIIHSATMEEHLLRLQKVLQRLRNRHLTINLLDSTFATDQAKVMGFRLYKGTIAILPDQTKALANCEVPTSAMMIKSFLGLTNFFRGHIRDYANLSAPLNQLVRTGSGYKGGPMPDDAIQAFYKLRTALLSDPVLTLPRPDRQFAVIVDAATGSETTQGGLGAILAQLDHQGRFHAICYASRRLNEKETQYSPFLLEMAAAVWAIKSFKDHLSGVRFILFTDHKPLQKVALANSKTLTEFQQLALQFDFITQYKQGINMPADFLSRTATPATSKPVVNEISSVSLAPQDLAAEQTRSPDLVLLRHLQKNKSLPDYTPKLLKDRIQALHKSSFTDPWNRIWTRLNDLDNPRTILLAPASIRNQLLQNAHGSSWAGHDGQDRVYARITTSYYWPGLKDDIAKFLASCTICQKKNHKGIQPIPLRPLPIPDSTNFRVHVDLMGPLKSHTNNKYILAITDAFTKVGVLAPLPDKEATTVAKALLHHWIYRFSIPKQIHSDQGKEFCNKVLQELFSLLGTTHTTTTAYHPQANAQVERLNRTILNYLRAQNIDDSLDWEKNLPIFEFHYNSSFHSSLHTTPFKMLYGHEETPNSMDPPSFQSHKQRWDFIKDLHQSAQGRQQLQKEAQKKAHDKHATPHSFQQGQQVLIKEHNFLGRNHKIAPHWIGPATIIQIQDDTAWVQLPKKPKKLINVKNLKPYQSPEPTTTPPFKEFFSQGEEQHTPKQADQTINLISGAHQLAQTIQNQATGSSAIQALINLINQTQAIANNYLRELYLKVLRSPFGSPDPLTSEERTLFENYQPWERNLLTSGNPLFAPEYRTRLCAMPGRPKNLPPAPMGPMVPPAAPVANPVPVQAAPAAPPGPGPQVEPIRRPAAAPAAPVRNRRMKRTVEPSDRTLRSKGAPEFGLLPENKRTRTPTKSSTAGPSPAPVEPSTSSGGTPAPASPAKEPGFGLLRAVGQTLFGRTPAASDPGAAPDPGASSSSGSFRFF